MQQSNSLHGLNLYIAELSSWRWGPFVGHLSVISVLHMLSMLFLPSLDTQQKCFKNICDFVSCLASPRGIVQ